MQTDSSWFGKSVVQIRWASWSSCWGTGLQEARTYEVWKNKSQNTDAQYTFGWKLTQNFLKTRGKILIVDNVFRKQMVQKQRDYLKKKKQKKQQRFKEIEEERETEKNKWLNFAGKVRNANKESTYSVHSILQNNNCTVVNSVNRAWAQTTKVKAWRSKLNMNHQVVTKVKKWTVDYVYFWSPSPRLYIHIQYKVIVLSVKHQFDSKLHVHWKVLLLFLLFKVKIWTYFRDLWTCLVAKLK